MRKFAVLIFTSILMFSSGALVDAKVPRMFTNEKAMYMSTERILFLLIEPRLDKIVKDQYGKQMIINPMRVNEAGLITNSVGKDSNADSGWFQLDMLILVGDPSENPKMDRVVLKIDAPNIGPANSESHSNSDEIKDIKVELVNYMKE